MRPMSQYNIVRVVAGDGGELKEGEHAQPQS
jgi:hypothetical protein